MGRSRKNPPFSRREFLMALAYKFRPRASGDYFRQLSRAAHYEEMDTFSELLQGFVSEEELRELITETIAGMEVTRKRELQGGEYPPDNSLWGKPPQQYADEDRERSGYLLFEEGEEEWDDDYYTDTLGNVFLGKKKKSFSPALLNLVGRAPALGMVPGTEDLYIHVFNEDQPSSADDLRAFMAIQGEVCFSNLTDESTLYVRHPKRYMAVVMRATPRLVAPGDVYSFTDYRGRRYPSREAPAYSRHDEAFVCPALSEMQAVLITPGNRKLPAIKQATDELGIPLVLMQSPSYDRGRKKNDEAENVWGPLRSLGTHDVEVIRGAVFPQGGQLPSTSNTMVTQIQMCCCPSGSASTKADPGASSQNIGRTLP